MKHAYLIIAYQQPAQLVRLIQALDDEDNGLFIHLDATSSLDPNDFRQVAQASACTFIDCMRIAWGGDSSVRYELDLLHAAVSDPAQYDYFHLLFWRGLPDEISGGRPLILRRA